MGIFSSLKQKIKLVYSFHPLRVILILALLTRLVSVVFSKGYGMHDDHFLVIETSQSWVDGTDYNNWLPENRPGQKPDGHSFFYVGIHFILFSILKWLGIQNPETKMYIIRALHALFSLLVVYYGYGIARMHSNKKTAAKVGLLLAVFWFFPFLSVRNLVEIAAIPFLMMGLWLTLKSVKRNENLAAYLLAGLVMGIAVSVRFQTVLFLMGVGLALLLIKKWKEAVFFGIGGILSIIILQGITDFIIWKYPFAELREYIVYNLENKFTYGNNNFMMYPSVLFGILIPPVSLFLIFGLFREWKRLLLIFVPVMIFFLFHEYFPNKQERFILTIVPFIIIPGVIGWNNFADRSSFWQKRQKLLKGCYNFFWVANIILLVFASTAYTKRSRVESMSYLYQKKDQVNAIIIDNNDSGRTVFTPMFYMGKFVQSYQYAPSQVNTDSLALFPARHQRKFVNMDFITSLENNEMPQYILFYDNKDIEKRIDFFKQYFPYLTYETTIQPSYLDRLMCRLNPVNVNQIIYIYALNKKADERDS